MKYLITESQIDRVIFKYLDNQDFIQVEYHEIVCFINSEGDEYAQIKFYKNSRWCSIETKLMIEIASFFSIPKMDALSSISAWAHNKLGVHPRSVDAYHNIPVYF